jgi:hypothetical protein
MRGRRRNWTDKELGDAVAECTSIAQVLRRLGLRAAGGNYDQIKAKVKALGFGTGHWTGQAHLRGKPNPHAPRQPLAAILRRGIAYQSNKLRKRLIKEAVFEARCASCGGTEWLHNLIPLELDHIDGDKTNNEISNLRLICPNCHALTPTYRGKNTKYGHIPPIDEIKAGIARWGSMAAFARTKGASPVTAKSWLLKLERK